MSWSFEASLLVFLVIAFMSQAVAVATKGRLSLPFALGVFCTAGFALGLLPVDIASKSKMKDVGFIAFNVLVVHSGTLIDIKAMLSRMKIVLISIACLLVIIILFGFGLAPIIGRELALFSIGPVVGGGAACAIASNAAIRKLPGIAAFPWIIFMFQGFFGLPLLAFSLKKEHARLKVGMSTKAVETKSFNTNAEVNKKSVHNDSKKNENQTLYAKRKLYDYLPESFKNPAYYLASIMLVAILNRLIYSNYLAKFGLHPSLSALVLGFLFANLGLLERNPLEKTEAMGLLMLGLMSLMADALSVTPSIALLKMMPLAFFVLALATAAIAGAGALAGRISGEGATRGLLSAASCMIGLPPAVVVAKPILRAIEKDNEIRSKIEAELLPDIDIASTVVTNVLAIAVAGVVGLFL